MFIVNQLLLSPISFYNTLIQIYLNVSIVLLIPERPHVGQYSSLDANLTVIE